MADNPLTAGRFLEFGALCVAGSSGRAFGEVRKRVEMATARAMSREDWSPEQMPHGSTWAPRRIQLRYVAIGWFGLVVVWGGTPQLAV